MAKRSIFIIEDSRQAGNLRVDRDRGIIRGVKILGLVSENGRQYLPDAVRKAAKLYEGIRVNIDHPDKPDDVRSAEARFGKLVRVRYVEGEGLYGDLEFLKSHPMAERICEAAERMPDAFGLSHNAQGEGDENKDGIFVVSKIVEVRHVDVVADPATTKSLSEGRKMNPKSILEKDEIQPTMEADNAQFGAKAAEILNGEGDTAEKVQALVQLVHDMYGAQSTEEAEDSKEMKPEDEEKDLEEDGVHVDIGSHQGEKDEDEDEDEGEEDEKEDEDEMPAKLGGYNKKPMESKRSHVRRVAKAAGVKLTEAALNDLLLLPSDAAVRQIKRIALAQRAARPRSAGYVPANLAEGKLPSGESLFKWLRN